MRTVGKTSKTLRARELGISRGTMYYQPKMPEKDWRLKSQIEEVLRKHPSYGSPRIAMKLKRNPKPIERVMKIFGIKAYRRRGKRWKKSQENKSNLPKFTTKRISKLPQSYLGFRFHLHSVPRQNSLSGHCHGFIHSKDCRSIRNDHPRRATGAVRLYERFA